MPEVTRIDPSKLSTTVKEAVADAIVNMTHAHVSGAGSVGKFLFGARPRTLLNSGFILPQLNATGGDEVTSPIWISSHGFQFQLGMHAVGTLKVQPSFAVYVRVLPREEDFRRPDCKLAIKLRREMHETLRTQRDQRLDEEWEKVKGAYPSRWKHPEWPAIKQRVVAEVHSAHGVPTDLRALESEEPSGDENESSEEGVEVGAESTLVLSDAHFQPMAIPHKWVRLPIQVPPLLLDAACSAEQLQAAVASHAVEMNATVRAALEAWRSSEESEEGGRLWGYRRGAEVQASQYRNWSAFLAQVRGSDLPILVPEIELSWNLETSVDWADPSKMSVLLALENISKPPRIHADETEEAVFQVALQAEIPAEIHRPLRLERVDPSYRYNQYLSYSAMGHNCGVQVLEAVEGLVSLTTTWAPRYTQPRIVPTEVPGVNRDVRALSTSEGFEDLKPLVPEFEKWLAIQPTLIDPSHGLATDDADGRARETAAFEKDLSLWRNELESIRAGIEILEESRRYWTGRGPQSDGRGVVFEAWLAMNEAMADFMKIRFKRDDNKWRLFQLAFIVANIPTFATRLPEFKAKYQEKRDDAVTLLYFATGGGKSEAFFGLLVFTLLFDRLRGKKTGVTAMLRYPLRLLTIQQAQRCSKVMAQAELVRRKHGYGGQALSLGFWVGSTGSPNRHSTPGVASIPTVEDVPPDLVSEQKLRDRDQKYFAAWRAWNKIPKCPFCSAETALRRFPVRGGTLAHVCSNSKCSANGSSWEPLPFYICDEDIYDLAPSVLLGTVDKLALIGHSAVTIRRIMGMFGTAPWLDPATGRLKVPAHNKMRGGPAVEGMRGLYPAYGDGERFFFDPFPSLVIQDEAHLLDESLGTFAALFESTLDAIFEHLSRSLGTDLVSHTPGGKRRRAKVVAASATVSEPERQLEHLYQRSIPAVQFPHPGPTLYDSFYAMPEVAAEASRASLGDVELRSKQARMYCAFMTNGKPHTATSVAVLANFHLTISKLFDRLNSGEPILAGEARALLLEFVSPGPLSHLHQQGIQSASDSDLTTAVDLHRIALTYVTNKKGGDQIMAAESEEARKRHLNAGQALTGLDTRLITGSVEQGEIQAVVQAAQTRDEPGRPFTPLAKVLRSVIATSAISHGVDVEELNSMFFAGMPSDIAEYIQASSRVGRTHVGFVVLVPTPQRRRDRQIIEVFDIFHRFLERMVQPAAIDRWAEKAVERVHPSMLQAYLAGIVPSRKLLEADASEKHTVPSFYYLKEVLKEQRERQGAFLAEINAFIELAIGLKDGYCPEGEEHYRRMIVERTRDVLGTWDSDTWREDGTLKSFFEGQPDAMRKPMTSLRDVDESGVIRATRKYSANRPLPAQDILTVMDLIRDGVSGSEDVAEQ
ncbi:DEAD/DEAH box helicase family protein [Hydrogenophaga sp.]|uniref:DEAD/DEAH box helicase family protein n=1 Tax=Hydrogenophaga sp. TaxID=1904254 RepID=UPI00271E502B|nr:DEAD/DEAH box helicase family protein [Hydrogenophaga sp.]MDO9506592.1 DEAD/DEAH box helicase family protein [Hydrogenophaga sp.]